MKSSVVHQLPSRLRDLDEMMRVGDQNNARSSMRIMLTGLTKINAESRHQQLCNL